MSTKQVYNFAPGPATLPKPVLEKISKEFMNYAGTGCNVMELSHRSKEFTKILNDSQDKLRKIMKIPDNYKIVFLSGGATQQFAGIPLNLVNIAPDAPVDYCVTGTWSQKAAKEAKKYTDKVNIALDNSSSKHTTLPPTSEWKCSPDATYLYYCANETVHGVEFKDIPEVPSKILVADMTSNFASAPLDISKFGVIVASLQKNLGPAGQAVAIIREDCLGKAMTVCPSTSDWKVMSDNNSVYNTCDTWGIYVLDLVLDWIIENGGVDAMNALADKRADRVWQVVEKCGGFYSCPVDKSCRSRMNIPMRLNGGDEKLEAAFLTQAKEEGLLELKGHRSVGGLRISLYNAMPYEGADAVATFMEKFFAANTNTAPTTTPTDSTPAASTEKFNVLVMDKCDPKAVAILQAAGHTADEKAGLSEDELVEIIPNYSALIVRSATIVTEKIIRAGKNLKIIGRAGVGVDNIKIPIATECGITVINSPQGNTISAAEHTWGMILAMTRMIPQAYSKLKNEKVWDRKSYVGRELAGKTIAILGFGNVGKTVGKYALAFGMSVVASDPFVSKEQGAKFGAEMMELEECLKVADVITMHLPSIPSTQKIICERTINMMKKGVMLANVGRGECIDDNDLAAALKSGQVGAAGLDVFAPEPLVADSPYYECSNVVLTPHLGASTKEAQVKVAIDVSEQIVTVLAGGKARTPVNKL